MTRKQYKTWYPYGQTMTKPNSYICWKWHKHLFLPSTQIIWVTTAIKYWKVSHDRQTPTESHHVQPSTHNRLFIYCKFPYEIELKYISLVYVSLWEGIFGSDALNICFQTLAVAGWYSFWEKSLRSIYRKEENNPLENISTGYKCTDSWNL